MFPAKTYIEYDKPDFWMCSILGAEQIICENSIAEMFSIFKNIEPQIKKV